MFFEGDLQSGISLAIQEHKLVACFVRQDDDECSQKWENEWLKAPLNTSEDDSDSKALGEQLAEKAVLLRIDAGSQEAGFLGAFCSLHSFPKLLVIQAGSVVEDIDAGVSQETFNQRISALLSSRIQQSQQPPQPERTIPGNADSATADVSQILSNVPFIGEQGTSLEDAGAAPRETAETNVPFPAPTGQGNNATLQQMLTERGTRLEAERRKKEEAEKEARKAAAKARKEAADKETAESSSAPQKRQDWADQQRNRQKEDRLERERILKTIESDKAARREKEQQRRQQAQTQPSTAAAQSPVQTDTAPGRDSNVCAIQIRLFDGSSLRTRFDPSATLATSVRTYISQNSQTDIPYEFRQILLPNPSRNISVGEENESLRSLGLTPSATLVLVPIKGYTDAYSNGGGLVSKGFNAGYGILSGAASMLGNAVGSVMGYGGPSGQGPYVAGTADESEASNAEGDRMAHRSAGINIRTLGDQRREAEQGTELYNGNQLNFEPRKKKDEQGDAKDD